MTGHDGARRKENTMNRDEQERCLRVATDKLYRLIEDHVSALEPEEGKRKIAAFNRVVARVIRQKVFRTRRRKR